MQGLTNPSIQGLMTAPVSEGEQGKLQGANTSLMGLTGLIGPSRVLGHVRPLHPAAPRLDAAGRVVPARVAWCWWWRGSSPSA
jgi:DHA1 family tetracycline resistance protein-like MFS transporter